MVRSSVPIMPYFAIQICRGCVLQNRMENSVFQIFVTIGHTSFQWKDAETKTRLKALLAIKSLHWKLRSKKLVRSSVSNDWHPFIKNLLIISLWPFSTFSIGWMEAFSANLLHIWRHSKMNIIITIWQDGFNGSLHHCSRSSHAGWSEFGNKDTA